MTTLAALPFAIEDVTELAPADADRDKWLALRQSGIGGSDALAVLGMDRWKSRLGVYFDKLGDAPEREDNDAMEWGRDVEPVIADWFAKKTGIAVYRCGLLSNNERPWQLLTPDRITADRGLLEIKNTSMYRASEWDDEQIADGAEAQLQHGLAVTGLGHGWAVAAVAGHPPVIRRVERDDALIADMIAIEAEFWQMVCDRTPPAIDGSVATAELLARMHPHADEDAVGLSTEAIAAAATYRAIGAEIKRMEAAQQLCRNTLEAELGAAQAGLSGDKTAVSWRNTGQFNAETFAAENPDLAAAYTRPAESLDAKALKADHPDLHRRYRSRRFLVTKES